MTGLLGFSSGGLADAHGGEYGPDGMPVQEGTVMDSEGYAASDQEHQHGVEVHDMGWFRAESNRAEQAVVAQHYLQQICTAVDEHHMAGTCTDGRWVNDPEEFPDLQLRGTLTANAVTPFPPHDQQYYIRGLFDPSTSKLRKTAIPSHGTSEEECNSVWVRLVDFADHADASHLFDEFAFGKENYGRVFQGALDNGYFVEALQAISLRPKLARQLFYCWDTRRSVYVARMYKHGTWLRVELDDYVPVGRPGLNATDDNVPICCRSEFFPHVLWPSLVEKAYAKVHTLRGSTMAWTEDDRGGWEAIGGGGQVETVLADLTGGVAGRFHTCDITMDRLFIYIYELQRDTLFVCRPHQTNCDLHGVRLNPYYPNVVNRAITWEGRLYVQLFCGAPGVYDGGLQDIDVPFTLVHCEDYPETVAEGFYWITAEDFHEYFDTIFECRLVNSGDVAIRNMPPPRLPMAMPTLMPGMPQYFQGPGGPPGNQHLAADGSPLAWFEWVYANPGEVTCHNEPEFGIKVPQRDVPCEIVLSVEQLDPRMTMEHADRPAPAAILVKVYESVDGPNNMYRSKITCKSNWIPIRDSVCVFNVTSGGDFKVVAELPTRNTKLNRMIFRCYTSRPGVVVTAGTALMKHLAVECKEAPKANRATVIGSEVPHRIEQRDKPQILDDDHDCMRRPEWDIDPGWNDVKAEFHKDFKDCSVM